MTAVRNILENTSRSPGEASKLAHRKYPESFKHSDETKEKIRQKRLSHLEENREGSPWDNRSKGKMSYLEKWFFDEVIKKQDLAKRFDIVNEFSIYPYSIDFAFVNIKLAVELDGRCHFDNGKNRIDHDIKKDKFLTEEKGWKIFRISFNELNEETIERFLEVIDNISEYSYQPKKI